jgi:hypothetical protein
MEFVMLGDTEEVPGDPPTLSPKQSETIPTWRAAYSDRTSALMAAFSQLAYLPYEAVSSPPASGAPKMEKRTGREELERHLGAGNFRLVSTINSDDAHAFLAVRDEHFAVLAGTLFQVFPGPRPGVTPIRGTLAF